MAITPDAVLALAALAQAAESVYQLATTSNCKNDQDEVLVNSLFVFEAQSTEAIYGKAENLAPGLAFVKTLADGNHDRKHSAEILKYGFSLLHLERKLASDKDMLSVIRSRLEHIELKQQHFSSNHNNAADLAAISALYQDTLSTMRFRIQVNGKAQYLQQVAIADRIRSVLFSGVRAAMLWRQLGGKQWQLFFQRKEVSRLAGQWQKSFQQ